MQALDEALTSAEPGSFIRIFVDEGLPMAQLLSQAAARGMMPDYLGKLLAAFEAEQQETENKSDRPSAQPLVEPLSQRELEVRSSSPRDFSNDEIGKRLFLALDTVATTAGFSTNSRCSARSCRPRPASWVCCNLHGYTPPHSLFSVKQNNTSINTKVSTQPPVLRIYCLSLSNRRILMDIYEAIYTTRAMRRLKPDPIPYDVQARILDAAIHAPHIGEGWRFILVDDPAIKSQLARLYRQGFERIIAGRPKRGSPRS